MVLNVMCVSKPEFVARCPELSLRVARHVYERAVFHWLAESKRSRRLKGPETLADESRGACSLARVLLLLREGGEWWHGSR